MKTKLIVAILMTTSASIAQNFKAERVQKSASFVANASIEKVFPLFGPIREKEWTEGWEPQIVYSTNSEVEEHMVFKTSGGHHGEREYLWVLTQFKPKEYFVEYTVSTSNRVWFISVKCEPKPKSTKVIVTYTFTSLTEQGNQLNKLALEKMYAHNLKDWEEDINYYLTTGKRKSH
ncbi:MAG TPA: hypothetical protein VL728_07505 [Cyclobacteriaceae bacterium]|nr:hypothetical protein [Cyclobacteriaceae bacterium]